MGQCDRSPILSIKVVTVPYLYCNSIKPLYWEASKNRNSCPLKSVRANMRCWGACSLPEVSCSWRLLEDVHEDSSRHFVSVSVWSEESENDGFKPRQQPLDFNYAWTMNSWTFHNPGCHTPLPVCYSWLQNFHVHISVELWALQLETAVQNWKYHFANIWKSLTSSCSIVVMAWFVKKTSLRIAKSNIGRYPERASPSLNFIRKDPR